MSISLSTFVFSSPQDDYKLSAKSFLYQEIAKYGNAQYAELPVLLSVIRTTAMLHQQNHWVSKEKTFYGDHLLFMRLYEETDKVVDVIAEKTVGFTTEELVCLSPQISHISALISLLNNSTGQKTPVESSYQITLFLNALTTEVFNSLESSKLLTPGLEQTIGTLLETIEAHSYLLKQRFAK